MAMVLLCVVLETEMFTLNFFLQAKTFLRPNFTTRMTNIQTLGLNMTNIQTLGLNMTNIQTLGLNMTNLRKHMTIRNERNIKDLFTDNGGQTGQRVYFTHGHLHLYALTRHFT